jgi:hypothetical protein
VNPELAQLIALAAHGTAWLRSSVQSLPPELDAKNSAFKNVRVRFELRSAVHTDPLTATTVAEWLQQLRARDVDRIMLAPVGANEPDGEDQPLAPHLTVAFAGGTQWRFLVTSALSVELWTARWRNRRSVLEGTYWSEALFESSAHSERVAPRYLDVVAATSRLNASLREAADFARTRDLKPWAEQFEHALKRGTETKPTLPSYRDALPVDHPGSAKRLLAQALEAWVFGGMGSWNDVLITGDTDRAKYDKLTSSLYAAVIDACAAAANAEPDR